MTPQCRPLIEILAQTPAFRHQRGKRHSLAAACRRFAARPWRALALLGTNPDNEMALMLCFQEQREG